MDTGEVVRTCSGTQAVGWRVWTVQERPEGIRLGSVIHDAVWTPGLPAHASCLHDEHAAPEAECNCGFHAARDPVDAFSYLHGRDEPGTIARVLGEVLLSGTIIEAERGWRAAQAYPLRLYAHDPELELALASYGVPVLCPACASAPVTSSMPASAGSQTSSWNVARTRSSPTAASG
jgi:hypothetical protein